jgi:hypothetical protein
VVAMTISSSKQQSTTTTDNFNEFVNNVDNNSRKTISMSTMHKIVHNKQSLQVHVEAVHLGIRHRCPNCKSTFTQKALRTSSSCVRTKAVQCDRCRKRFPERDWLAEHKVWHSEVDSDRYLHVVRFAYPCFYCCNYFASAVDVRAHIFAGHINNQPFKITIKTEESSNDDDDGGNNASRWETFSQH